MTVEAALLWKFGKALEIILRVFKRIKMLKIFDSVESLEYHFDAKHLQIMKVSI